LQPGRVHGYLLSSGQKKKGYAMKEAFVPLDLLLNPKSRRGLLQSFGAAAVGLSFGSLAACGKKDTAAGGTEEAKLNFYNWDTYIGPSTLDDFKSASGINVSMSLFANNDELFAKLRGGNPGFDVIVPSNEFVERMVQSDMLQPLDHAKLPNMKNLLPEFSDAVFDPGRQYSMPYTWLVLGIGYRKSKVQGIPDSWKWLFDSDTYKGRISLLAESADVFRLGFKYLGKGVNDYSPEAMALVEKMMIAQKPNIKVFHEDNGQDLLLSGEVDVVLEYNGDIAQIMEEDKDIGFVVPKEGSLLNSDSLCIPKGAPHPDNAHKFINNLMDANVGKKIYDAIKYPCPNGAAKALMDDSYKNNPVIFPPAEMLAKCEYGKSQTPEIIRSFEEAMTRVRAA
jgi:spermidine/putrescine transport system substrate-binding protein